MNNRLLIAGGLCGARDSVFCLHSVEENKRGEYVAVVELVGGDGFFKIPIKHLRHLNTNHRTIPLIGGKLVREQMMGDKEVAFRVFEIDEVYVRINYFSDEIYVEGSEEEPFQQIQSVSIIGYEGIEIDSLMRLQAACALIMPFSKIGYYEDAAKEFKLDKSTDFNPY
jgi:hypothetical protein